MDHNHPEFVVGEVLALKFESIDRSLGRIENKLDTMNGSIAANTRWRWMMAGGGIMISFFVGGGFVTAIALAFIGA